MRGQEAGAGGGAGVGRNKKVATSDANFCEVRRNRQVSPQDPRPPRAVRDATMSDAWVAVEN